MTLSPDWHKIPLMEKKETFWSAHVENYEQLQRDVTGGEIIDLVLRELRKESGLGSVLEFGCGTGQFTEAILGGSDRILATDFSDEMIAKAREMRGNLDRVVFEKADATNLPYENAVFDTVFMANFIHLVDDPSMAIRESHRVLKPGGTILLTSFAVDEMSPETKDRVVGNFVRILGIPLESPAARKPPPHATSKIS